MSRILIIDSLYRRQGNFELRDISFRVENGEIYTILGPSGAGKTTLLDCIAGFRKVHSGKIILDNKDITYLPPEKRDIAYIPQEPALFPHMSIMENIEYGLRVKKVAREERERLIRDLASSLGINNILDKYPREISGGEKQRVALARALVIDPKLMLMDEPLAHLDAPLRKELRKEIRREIKSRGVSTIYVTHDQSEAFMIADRIAIMKDGVILDENTPLGILESPKSIFSAKFLGYENLFKAQVVDASKDITRVTIGDVELLVPGRHTGELYIGFRPEDVVIFITEPTSSIRNILEGEIVEVLIGGSTARVIVDVGVKITALITRRALRDLDLKIGKHVLIGIKSTSIKILRED